MRWASSLEGETLRVYQTAKGGGQSGAIVARSGERADPGGYLYPFRPGGRRHAPGGQRGTDSDCAETATLPAGVTITGNVNYNLVLDGTSTAAADAFLQGAQRQPFPGTAR